MPPNRGLSGFLRRKLALVGRMGLPELFCGPQICQNVLLKTLLHTP